MLPLARTATAIATAILGDDLVSATQLIDELKRDDLPGVIGTLVGMVEGMAREVASLTGETPRQVADRMTAAAGRRVA